MSSQTRRDLLGATAIGTIAGLGNLVTGQARGQAVDARPKEGEPPSGTLKFLGKVQGADYQLPPPLLTGWDSFKIGLGTSDAWSGAVFTVSSAWGDSNSGKDLWGWIGGAGVAHGPVQRDAEGYFFIYSLQSGVGTSKSIAANFRYVLRNGSHGVANVYFPFA